MCQVGKKQMYISTFDDKIVAALIFDIIAIQQNGPSVSTNFSFTLKDILAIFSMGSMLDYKANDRQW